ncbi:hypothetical protein GF352_01460 [archaeon]|nr:hypothetical protein [archaeon]
MLCRYLTKDECTRTCNDYFQSKEVKKLLENNVILTELAGSILLPGEKELNHDIDLLFFKKPGIPTGEYLIAQTQLIKGLRELLVNEYGVNGIAFPKLSVEDFAKYNGRVFLNNINKGLKTNVFRDEFGRKVDEQEFMELKKIGKTEGTVGIHNLNYVTLTDYQNATFCPEEFRKIVEKGLVLFGDPDNIYEMPSTENNKELKKQADICMTFQDFNMINTPVSKKLFIKRTGHGIDYINKHVFGEKTSFRDEDLTRSEATNKFLNTCHRLDAAFANA